MFFGKGTLFWKKLVFVKKNFFSRKNLFLEKKIFFFNFFGKIFIFEKNFFLPLEPKSNGA